jgi:signal transduction histidine kinase
VLHPGRTLRLEVQGDTRGNFDPDRAAQSVSNLIANALNYSPQDTPVDVSVRETGDSVLLEVHNAETLLR